MNYPHKKTILFCLLLLLSLCGSMQGSQSSETASGLTVSSGPALEPETAGTPEAASPVPSETDTAPLSATASPAALSLPAAGWHGKGTKKFYILKGGKKAKGYRKIEGSYYFFKEKNGYAFVSGWKKVKISGKKYLCYFKKSGKREMDVSKRLSGEKSIRYLLETNLTTNSVMVYATRRTDSTQIPVRRMRCSAGMPGHGTITGAYRLCQAGSRWRVLRYGSYGQYCSRISGPYLYHSVVYDRYGDPCSLNLTEYKKLGKSASHGCIRLQVADAKWIYEHASLCTAHLYYGKEEKLPIPYPARKKAGKTTDGRHYDPTDDIAG